MSLLQYLRANWGIWQYYYVCFVSQFDCVVKTKRSLLLSDCCTFQTIRRHQSDDLCIIKTFHIFSQKVVLFRFYGFFCSIPTFEWIESHEIDPKELENTIETEIHITMNRGFSLLFESKWINNRESHMKHKYKENWIDFFILHTKTPSEYIDERQPASKWSVDCWIRLHHVRYRCGTEDWVFVSWELPYRLRDECNEVPSHAGLQ